jgi:chromosome segregation ATPase
MIARRRASKQPRVSPPSARNGGDYTAVLLEEMRAQHKVAFEAILELGHSTQRSIAELRSELITRIDAVEDAVRQCFRRLNDVDSRLGAMDLRFAAIDDRLASMDARFDKMDARFDGIDARFDGIDARFDDIDRELKSLREEVARKGDRASLAALEQRVTALERRAGV